MKMVTKTIKSFVYHLQIAAARKSGWHLIGEVTNSSAQSVCFVIIYTITAVVLNLSSQIDLLGSSYIGHLIHISHLLEIAMLSSLWPLFKLCSFVKTIRIRSKEIRRKSSCAFGIYVEG